MEEPASLKEKEKERIFSEIISGLLIITTILKVKSIAFQVFFEFFFFFFLVQLAHLRISKHLM